MKKLEGIDANTKTFLKRKEESKKRKKRRNEKKKRENNSDGGRRRILEGLTVFAASGRICFFFFFFFAGSADFDWPISAPPRNDIGEERFTGKQSYLRGLVLFHGLSIQCS